MTTPGTGAQIKKDIKPEELLLGRSRRQKGLAASIRRLGWPLIETIYTMGFALRFMGLVVSRVPQSLGRFGLIWHHIFMLGTRSLPTIIVAGLFIGLVLGLQFHTILSRYGQPQLTGAVTALTVFRELGPVMASLLYIGSACTAITASIGLMRSSEQISSMEIMAVDPIAHQITPRFIAGTICLPLLTIILMAISIVGSYLIAVLHFGLEGAFFWGNMQKFTKFVSDFGEGMVKSLCFGVLCNLIALYHGYTAKPTAEGVARSTTRAVVHSCLTVLMVDFVITSLII